MEGMEIMWLWSKGLGRLVLPMDLGEAKVGVEGDQLVIKGWIIAPKIYWDYTLSLEEKDLLDSTALLADRHVMSYLARTAGLGFLALLLRRSLGFGFYCFGAQLGKVLGSPGWAR